MLLSVSQWFWLSTQCRGWNSFFEKESSTNDVLYLNHPTTNFHESLALCVESAIFSHLFCGENQILCDRIPSRVSDSICEQNARCTLKGPWFSRWWFQILLILTLYLGKWSNWTSIFFSDGLVETTNPFFLFRPHTFPQVIGNSYLLLPVRVMVPLPQQLEVFLTANGVGARLVSWRLPWSLVAVGGWRITRWWFQIFYIFTPTFGRFPFWLIFFKWVETTNQISFWG